MTKQLQIGLVSILMLVFANAAMAQEPTSPVIVARFTARNITASIQNTTVFTPTNTGLYRVSVYEVMTNAATSNAGNWYLYWNYVDEVGPESAPLTIMNSSQVPNQDFAQDADGYGVPAPFLFETVAGQPVSFVLDGPTNGANPGTCALTIIVERLE
jgi:hypothetical protein